MSGTEKHKLNLRRLASIILLARLFLSVSSCHSFGDPIVGAKGTVSNQDGDPIEGVSVTLINTGGGGLPRNATTQKDGKFEIMFTGGDPSQTKIVFQKDGYKTTERQLENSGIAVLNLTLDSN